MYYTLIMLFYVPLSLSGTWKLQLILLYVTGIEIRVLDVLSTDAVNEFAASLGKVDILFNCAG